jgi:hypothetical protein
MMAQKPSGWIGKAADPYWYKHTARRGGLRKCSECGRTSATSRPAAHEKTCARYSEYVDALAKEHERREREQRRLAAEALCKNIGLALDRVVAAVDYGLDRLYIDLVISGPRARISMTVIDTRRSESSYVGEADDPLSAADQVIAAMKEWEGGDGPAKS